MCFFEWLNVWMHLSAGLWVSCFMPYLSLIVKESLSFFPVTQTSSLRGEHKTHASVICQMVSCHTAGILHNGSKRLLSQYPSVSPCGKCAWVEEEGFADQRGLAIKSWQGCAEAQRKPQALSCSCGTCRTACISHEQMSASSVNRIAHSPCCA